MLLRVNPSLYKVTLSYFFLQKERGGCEDHKEGDIHTVYCTNSIKCKNNVEGCTDGS